MNTYKLGDLVKIHPDYATAAIPADKVWRVDKVNPVNLLLVPVNGSGRKLSANPALLVPASDADQARVETVPLLEPLWPATVVKVGGRGWREPADQLWVVLRDGGDGTYRVAKLGGDGGRYYRKVPRAMITPVDSDRLAAAWAAAVAAEV